MQERYKKFFPSIKLPVVTTEEDRGYAICCTPELVLANGSGETSENDVKSAWIKLSDPNDTVNFELTDSQGNALNFYNTPLTEEFINEPNAFFITIPWADVLSAEGVGCYRLNMDYDIGGIVGSLVWGTYNLKVFSIQNALGTCRLRSIFNLKQSIENINFTGSGVEDTIRFFGQIKPDQPNNEYEELIYESRKVETVVNENIPTYKLETDPHTDELLRRLESLYLLSSNRLYISDHNAHTSSYNIRDLSVTIDKENGPERETLDKYARQEILICKFKDRIQDKRTHY